MAEDRHHASGRGATEATTTAATPRDPLDALATRTRLARAAILWEALWPRLAVPLCILGVFFGLAWLRAFDLLPDMVRLAAVGALAIAFLASLVPALRVRLPDTRSAYGRMERDSGLDHHPLVALADDQAAGGDDPVARALWTAHRRRVADRLSAVRVAPPSPRLDRRDPYVLRAAVFLLVVVGLVAARGDVAGPVVAALRLPTVPGPEIRIDAWVTPPGYTRRGPIYLTAANPVAGETEAAPAAAMDLPVEVPQGSVVALRVAGLANPAVAFTPAGSDQPVALDPKADPAAVRPEDGVIRPTAWEYELEGAGTVSLSSGDGPVRSFRFDVTADQPPSIRLVEEPAATVRGAFRLAYEIQDDYRVAGAKATFGEPRTGVASTLGVPSANPRPLIGAPELPLVLPRRGAEKPVAETFKDLSAHPWAGATLAMTLQAGDDAGNVGRSDPVDVIIPARPFGNPVARMLVEQRRILALDANRAPDVVDILDTVGLFSPDFISDASVHLGLRVVRNRIADARSDDDLRAALEFMWQMALAIDGGDASLAEQRLREARERLREALQNGAPPEEIARLTEELRKAMDEYMQALQEQMRNNPNLAQQNQQPQNQQNMQEVSPEDFQKMIDRIEELSKLGDREAAEQLLSQLDQMLENLQMAQPQQGQPQDGQQGQMNQMMNELADMIRRQQELMNETFKQTPDGGQQNQQGQMSEQQMQEAMKRLQQGQADLQKRLEQMMQGMQQQGMQPGQELGQAGESMGQAEQSLGQGDSGQALGQQGQALDQLRRGAQQLAEQMGEGQGEGQGRQGRSAYSEDPLGRPQRREGPDFGDSVKVPGEIEVQRARRILDELRRRFSDQNRPTIELDYLQRLLTPF